jgi:hypothetical protein
VGQGLSSRPHRAIRGEAVRQEGLALIHSHFAWPMGIGGAIAADRTTYVSDYLHRIGLSLGADPATAITIQKGVDLVRFSPASDRAASRLQLGFSGPLLMSACWTRPISRMRWGARAASEGRRLQLLEDDRADRRIVRGGPSGHVPPPRLQRKSRMYSQ